MFTKSASFYDRLYAFKDYRTASSKVHDVVQARCPGASTLLDVGCGTGRHLEHLIQHYRVEGLDINPDLLEIARQRCPGVPFHQADMTNFDLGNKFAVVTCLFSSIGYVRTVENLRLAVANMARHLEPGGIVLIEPWFSPERYWTDTITANFVDEPKLKVAWMYTSERVGRLSVLDIHYLVGTPAAVEHFVERHEFGLFTDEQYIAALESAGLQVDFDRKGLFDRGLFIASPQNVRARTGSNP